MFRCVSFRRPFPVPLQSCTEAITIMTTTPQVLMGKMQASLHSAFIFLLSASLSSFPCLFHLVSLVNTDSKPLVASPAYLLVVVPLLDELVYHLFHLPVTFHLQILYQGIKSPWPIVGLYYWLVGFHNAGNP